MKIAFTGNCQAQTLTQMAHFLDLGAELIVPPPVFDIQAFDTKEIREEVLSADFIFAQRVSENYSAEYIRPSSLEELAPGKHLIWPNIYFDGYFPGIRYMYAGTGTKVTGPLSDYHFDQVEKMWQAGATVEDAWDLLSSSDAGRQNDPMPAETSIHMMRERESVCDITMSDFIENNFRKEKLFFSMNHPSDQTMLEALSRMLEKAQIGISTKDKSIKDLQGFPYTLNEIDLPTLPYVSNLYGLNANEDFHVTGRDMVLVDNQWKASDGRKSYSGLEMVDAFYRVYDSIGNINSHLTQGYD